MSPPFINSILSYLRGDGAVILPQMELTLFGLAILIMGSSIDESAEENWFTRLLFKDFFAKAAFAGTVFSAFTLWKLRATVAARGEFAGFQESVVVDPFFLFFGTLFLAATALVILLSVKYLEIEKEQEGEYYALLLFACVGMMFMASGVDLIVMFLGLETMALSFYVLTGFLRREKRSNEAALKYVLLGAFSSGILAYGFSIIYGLTGTTNTGNIQAAFDQRSSLGKIIEMSRQPSMMGSQAREVLEMRYPAALHLEPTLLNHAAVLAAAAFVLVAVGLFFKIAAVPFHQWAPDVYEGAPTPVTAYVSVASKTASSLPPQPRRRRLAAHLYALARGHSAHSRLHGQVFYFPFAHRNAPSGAGRLRRPLHCPRALLLLPYRRPRLAQAARRSPASHHDQRAGLCPDHRRICHPRRRVVS